MNDGIDDPKRRLVLEILVPVDLLLFQSPIGQRICPRPHGDSREDMDQLEMAALGHPLLPFVRAVNLKRKVRFLLIGRFCRIDRPRCKLGVGRHERAGDVMRHECRISVDVNKLDDIALTNDASSTRLGNVLGRIDGPVVVGVIERIPSDLLTWGNRV